MRLKYFVWTMLAFSAFDLQGKDLGKASFHAEGEGLALDIDGAGAKVEGDVKREGSGLAGGSFAVKLADFKTGIGLRDEHMCKALDCAKYPMAHFILDAFPLKDGPVSGELTLHGVTKKMSGWVAKVSGNSVKVSGKLKLKEFGIEPPGYQGAKVADEVEVAVEIQL